MALTARWCLHSFHRDASTTLAKPIESLGFCRIASLALLAWMLLYELRTVELMLAAFALPGILALGTNGVIDAFTASEVNLLYFS